MMASQSENSILPREAPSESGFDDEPVGLCNTGTRKIKELTSFFQPKKRLIFLVSDFPAR